MKEFITKIYEETDLQRNDITKVSKKIPSIYSKIIGMTDGIMESCIILQRKYNEKLKERYDFYKDESEEDIFSAFTSKSERDFYIKNSEKELMDLNDSINKLKNKLDNCERLIKYLKDLQQNISNIIQYEKFRMGA